MKTRSLQMLAGLAIIAFTACAPKLYTPGPTTVKDPSANIEELMAGRNVYLDKCGSCHNLKQPNKYTADQWTKIVDKMAPKAKINAEQAALVYKYVTSQK